MEVDDFSSSGPDDRHYVFDPEAGEIRFGNGLNGRVPQPTERIRARMYSHTGGAGGNLAAGHTWRFVAPALSALRARNSRAASGGAAKETLETAGLRARGAFRSITRAITAGDFTELARRTPGRRVAQVKVLPDHDPRLPCRTMPGHVTVIVLPFAPESAGPPRPSAGFLSSVHNHLAAARLVTTALHVVGPSFTRVSVGCSVYLAPGARADEARMRVERLLDAFLDPIRGGPARTGWVFGRAVFPSEIHALLTRDTAVDFVANVTLNGGPPEAPLLLDPTAVPVAGPHSILVVPHEEGRDARRSGRHLQGRRASGHA
jgi:predicted phage baseplate assembly protein